MSKLREELINAWNKPNSVQQCEKIVDDFAIKFADWVNENAYKYPTKTTTTKLLQIFKEKYYE